MTCMCCFQIFRMWLIPLKLSCHWAEMIEGCLLTSWWWLWLTAADGSLGTPSMFRKVASCVAKKKNRILPSAIQRNVATECCCVQLNLMKIDGLCLKSILARILPRSHILQNQWTDFTNKSHLLGYRTPVLMMRAWPAIFRCVPGPTNQNQMVDSLLIRK